MRRGTTRTDLKNGEIFGSSNRRGGSGVWAGKGAVTRTKPSRTLFVMALPRGITASDVEALFAKEPGYEGFRARRHMCFVDFVDVRHATAALRKRQGWTFGIKGGNGLAIDYDKDAVSKRNREYEKQRRAQAQGGDDAGQVYRCGCCRARFCSLEKGTELAKLPKRGTDGATVIEEDRVLRELWACKAPCKLVRRAKGIERQWPLLCSGCDVPIAYRPVPLSQTTRAMFVLPGALVTADVSGKPPGAARRRIDPADAGVEQSGAASGGAGSAAGSAVADAASSSAASAPTGGSSGSPGHGGDGANAPGRADGSAPRPADSVEGADVEVSAAGATAGGGHAPAAGGSTPSGDGQHPKHKDDAPVAEAAGASAGQAPA